MEYIKTFFFMFEMLPQHRPWDFMEWTMFGFILLLYIMVIGMILFGLYNLYRAIAYKSYYTKMKTYKGTVSDMKFVPRKTHSHWNGKTMVTRTTPEKNYVYIDVEGFSNQLCLNNDKLYQRVRVDESVSLDVQKEYVKPRFWEGELEFVEFRILRVTNIHDKTVIINDRKEQTIGEWELK